MAKEIEGFEWSAQKLRAAELLAQGELTIQEVVNQVGAAYTTVYNWRQAPEFAAKVAELEAGVMADLRVAGIAKKLNRLRLLDKASAKLWKALEHCEPEPKMMVMFAELRDTAKQAAQELGEWSEKQAIEHTGKDGGPIETEIYDHDGDMRAYVDFNRRLMGGKSGADSAGNDLSQPVHSKDAERVSLPESAASDVPHDPNS